MTNEQKSNKKINVVFSDSSVINVSGGNVISGNKFGDNANLSYNNTTHYQATQGGFINQGTINMGGNNNQINLGGYQKISSTQTKINQQWIQAGFTNQDKPLITFLQQQGYQSPQQALRKVKNITELRKTHQTYLEYKQQIEVILKPN